MSSEKKTVTQVAKVSWNDNGLPVSSQFDDIYFSTSSGIDESRYVFIDGNRLPERWQQLEKKSTFNIGETGFGSGLNFLVAWQLWESLTATQNNQLHFCSVEKYPLTQSDLKKALDLWPQLKTYSDELIAAYPPQPLDGIHQLLFNQGKVTLTLYFGDAVEGFSQLAPIGEASRKIAALNCANGTSAPSINAWFLDGFAPAKNPEMWSDDLFAKIKNLSSYDTSLATFTVAGVVRKGLIAADFKCEKIKGFGRKREMLIGQFSAKNSPLENEHSEKVNTFKKRDSLEHSWHLISKPHIKKIKHCIVIGGGLAGCHTAFALAQKNIAVTIIEKKPSLATQASGNRQGVVYSKLSPFQDPLSTFNLNTQIYADRFYKIHDGYQTCGDQCGVLHLAITPRQKQLYKQFGDRFNRQKDFAQWLSKEECQYIAGVQTHYPALYLPKSGWLDPVKLCNRLTQHPLINIKYQEDIKTLHHDSVWHISNASGECICQADALVIANAHDAQKFTQSQHLPLKQIRGQVTHIASEHVPSTLKSVLCGDGYIAPAHENVYTFGATFGIKDSNVSMTTEDHVQNLDKLSTLSPDFDGLSQDVNPQTLAGKVGFRCTTPDYFPIVGPVAHFDDMTTSFALLRKKAKTIIDEPGSYHPNLYCNVAYGSRGLCYAPLCAQLLANIISGDFLPIDRTLYRYLHPSRFLIRDLMRNKI